MISAHGIFIRKGDQILVNDASCELVPGHITAFIGSSGAGKTTILKALAGLYVPDKGSVMVNGNSITQLSPQERVRTVGYVFQDFNLFPHMTVMKNCADPLLIQGIGKTEAEEEVLELLHKLGVSDYTYKFPHEISIGQRQRVAIVRALCLKPQVLLLDEPTAALDPFNSDILLRILQDLAVQGLTIGLSSQDVNFIRKVFDYLYYVEQGTIVEFCDLTMKMDHCPNIARFLS
jgi:polar amino acid transport system ATP-binding protein